MKTIVVIVIFDLVFGRSSIVQTAEQTSEMNIFTKENEFNMYTNLLDVMQLKYQMATCDNACKLREMATKCCEIATNGPAPFNLILMSFLYYPKHKDFFEKEEQGTNTETQTNEEVVASPSDKEIVQPQPNEEVVASPSGKEIVQPQPNEEVVASPTDKEIVPPQPKEEVVASPPDKEIVPQSPEQPTQKDRFVTLAQSMRDVKVDILSIIEESNNYLKEIPSVSKQRLISCLVILTRVELNSTLFELYLKHIENTNAFNNILRGSLFSPLTEDISNLGMELVFDRIRPVSYKEPLIETTDTDLNAYQLENNDLDNCAKSLNRFKRIGKVCLSGAVLAVVLTTVYKMLKRT